MLYKLQLDNVQREIIQAQEVLTVIETQRDDAETAAADALSRLRYEEGIRRGRNVGYTEGRVVGLENGRSQMRETAAASVDRMLDTQEDEAFIVVPRESKTVPDSPVARNLLSNHCPARARDPGVIPISCNPTVQCHVILQLVRSQLDQPQSKILLLASITQIIKSCRTATYQL